METKPIAYRPITPQLAASGSLVTIKRAAAEERACESTLKANAKTGRLPAYQSHFGAPVMVLASEVREFLKSRPDIASRHHEKSATVSSLQESTPACAAPPDPGFPFPDEIPGHPVVRRCDYLVVLRPLRGASPATLTMVADCLSDIARQLVDTAEKEEAASQPID